jgi:predicted nucleic acid-binding protein
MNDAVVVDASVAMKWLIEEELSQQAEALYEQSLRAGIAIVAPPHLTIEVANALYRRRCGPRTASARVKQRRH